MNHPDSPAGPADTVARDAVAEVAESVGDVVERLSAFSDTTRLHLLVAIHAAPNSSVTELATATGLVPNTVSQALESLRRTGVVERRKVGRHSRWTVVDSAAHELLHHLGAPHTVRHPPH